MRQEKEKTMAFKVAVLDDYQDVALTMADWSQCGDAVEVTVFKAPLGDEAAVVAALADFEIVCLMRERTPFARAVIEALPNLRLIVTTGARNAAIDVAAARENNVTVCGTQSTAHATVEMTFAHILEFMRHVGHENARLKAGAAWQSTIGGDLNGRTLGIVGLGRLGSRVAHIAEAFGMNVIAWSRNLTPEKCAGTPARYVEKDALFAEADIVSLHVQLSERTRGLVGAAELGRMKPTALLVNTSRGPVVDETALVAALRAGAIAGAAIDVYDEEPLPLDHPLRGLERAQLTPHLGYVTQDTYRIFYGQTVEAIRAFLNGEPIRVIEP